MTNVTALDLSALLTETVSDETLEAIIDAAIDRLNLYGCEIPNLSGTSGSKTVSLTSAERGAVLMVAVAIYSVRKSSGSTSKSFSVGYLSQGESSSQTNNAIDVTAKEAARRLAEIEVTYG